MKRTHGENFPQSSECPKNDEENKPESTGEPTPKNPKREFPKRKFAILIGYVGTGFIGSQTQQENKDLQGKENMKTVEDCFFKALGDTKAIETWNANDLHKIGLSRASRTDKGVHALMNVLSAKLQMFDTPEKMTVEINNALLAKGYPNIWCYGLKQVTKGFNPKNSCDYRKYEYLCPAAVFLQKTDETLRIQIENEIKAKREPETKETTENPENPEKKQEKLDKLCKKETESIKPEDFARSCLDLSPSTLTPEEKKQRLERVHNLLGLYKGTHSFHNFTETRKVELNKTQRFVTFCGLKTPEPILVNGVECVVIGIEGQSFILHQIRKMIGLVIGVMRGYYDESFINTAMDPKFFTKQVPRAPGFPLCLFEAGFQNYNKFKLGNKKKQKKNKNDEDDSGISLDSYKEEANKRRMQIFEHVVEKEQKERSFAKWIFLLPQFLKDTTQLDAEDKERQKNNPRNQKNQKKNEKDPQKNFRNWSFKNEKNAKTEENKAEETKIEMKEEKETKTE